MKKLIIASAIAAASGSVLAAGAFDGPFVQIGIGGVGTENSNSYSNTGATQVVTGGLPSGTTSSGSFIGQVLGGYSQSIDKFNMAANIFYIIGNQDSGSQGVNGNYLGLVPWSATNQTKLKNTWGISVEPGYYLTDKTLGYLKFSWFNSSLNANGSVSALGVTDSISSSANVNGAGFGLGAKQMFTNNIYGYVEYQYVTYGSKSMGLGAETTYTGKPSQNYGVVGIGYKF